MICLLQREAQRAGFQPQQAPQTGRPWSSGQVAASVQAPVFQHPQRAHTLPMPSNVSIHARPALGSTRTLNPQAIFTPSHSSQATTIWNPHATFTPSHSSQATTVWNPKADFTPSRSSQTTKSSSSSWSTSPRPSSWGSSSPRPSSSGQSSSMQSSPRKQQRPRPKPAPGSLVACYEWITDRLDEEGFGPSRDDYWDFLMWIDENAKLCEQPPPRFFNNFMKDTFEDWPSNLDWRGM